MESDPVFDLESAIVLWRKRLSLRQGLSDQDIDEMESHLRDEMDDLAIAGMTDRECFEFATKQFGQEADLVTRFKRARWETNLTQRLAESPRSVANYAKVAYRNTVKHLGFSVINLLGLSIGIACFVTIALYVVDELSFDRFHQDADRTYRVVVDRVNGGATEPRIQTPEALGLAVPEAITDIETVTRFVPAYWGKHTLTYGDNTIVDGNYLRVENSFFDVFTYEFLRGSPEHAIEGPDSIVLTRTLAKKIFGDVDALGEPLILDGSVVLTVTAVVEDVPEQSHFSFAFLLQMPTHWDACWSANCGHAYTYVKLRSNAEPAIVEAKIQDLVEANQAEPREDTYLLQPLAGLNGIHLASHRVHELRANSNKTYIKILVGAAFFILAIAGFNYVNLSTAKASTRTREIGVRKIIGAPRGSLVRLFLAESVLISMLAGVVSVLLVAGSLPVFNHLMGSDLSLYNSGGWAIWLFISTIVVLLGLGAGMYPAFYLSAPRPAMVLKGLGPMGRVRTRSRRYLVVLQFVLATLLVVCSLVVQKQLDYVGSADLGFDNEQVLIIENFSKVPSRDGDGTARAAIENIPGVALVGSTTDITGRGDSIWGTVKVQGGEDEVNVHAAHVDYNYLNVVGIELVEGRYFSPEFETESSPHSVILNETAVRQLGLERPVLGQLIEDSAGRVSRIVGVVRDFHFASLHDRITPYVFFWYGKAAAVAARLHPGDMAETIRKIEATWSRFVPEVPMNFYFLDERIDGFYQSERSFRTLLSVMTGLSLLIACLGMFGLVAFTVDRRTKEIGIRRVLGATGASLAALLSREFVTLVLVGNLIAWPLSYWLMDKWLQTFAYHVDIGPPIFAMSGLIALVLTVIVVGSLAVRSVWANPASSLRYE